MSCSLNAPWAVDVPGWASTDRHRRARRWRPDRQANGTAMCARTPRIALHRVRFGSRVDPQVDCGLPRWPRHEPWSRYSAGSRPEQRPRRMSIAPSTAKCRRECLHRRSTASGDAVPRERKLDDRRAGSRATRSIGTLQARGPADGAASGRDFASTVTMGRSRAACRQLFRHRPEAAGPVRPRPTRAWPRSVSAARRSLLSGIDTDTHARAAPDTGIGH